ncbi:hypothetical protein BJI45_07205 [Limosilactobacillus reuteri]|uniref:Gram-positive cocci surface proteins LPxTG domain-containing protein n=5 Tax=Limosilactobacillus TaxID=2742598 RepID=A0AB36HZB3_LIMRT|nr:YSIRK-type signal peptide-containing protein [Limosilactobacillus reuteri]OJI10377.1 hypothetical protein BJI45_07205 [Limosilactobacillus reuteri]
MVGKNNNYVRESKSNEHFQRFALRKLSVGVVSVAVAAGFYLGSGATAQAATTESNASAKTEQVVQQNSTSAASDSTSTSNSSAAVSTSSATPVSTESASSMTVSDLPASASAASDNQASAANASESSSQSASSSVASDAAATVSKDSQAASEANSQSAADVETVQLPTSAANANANESQAANILGAQAVQKAANQQAPAGFTVTDPNYPAEMYKDPDASHYTYWWAQSSNGEYNLVLSTDRNGDGKVYVFLLGNNNNVLGKYTVDKNKSTEVATDDEGDFGTVYNDGQSGVFVTSDGTWKSKFNVFDPKAGEDDGDYGSISFMIPQVETQTTTYVTYFDSKGNKVDKPIEVSDPVIQKGLDGQIYTTKGGKVINGYFAKEPKNAHGFMSPFGKQGAIYTKDWHDGLKATFTETDTKTGLMHVVVKHYYHSWGTWRTVKEFDLAPGQSEKVDYDVYKSVTIHSIYIPQTINIQYTYEKLGNLVISSDSKSFPAEDKTQYPNDKSDSTKAGNVTIPKVAGFTPTINDKTVTNYTFNPSDYVSDLSKDINVVYVADTQEAAISFYDETDHKPLNDQTIQLTGKTGEKISHTEANQTLAKLGKQGYVVDQNTFADDATYDNDTQAPQEFTIYLKHDTTHTDATSSKADQKTVSETIHYVYKDGVNANKPVADDANTTVTFKRGYTTDKVTGKIVSYDPWTVDGKQADSKTFDAVKSPVIAGYTADQAEVAAQTVTPDSQNINKTVYYTADTQEATINFYDETDHKLLDNQTIHLTGKTGEKVDRTQADQTLADLVKQGYVLDKENTAKAFPADAVYDNNDQTPQEFTIYLKHGTTHTDATSSKADQKTVSETIHYVYKDGVNANKPVADDANTTVTFKRGYTTDKVTGKIVSYDPWTVDGKQADSKTFDAVKSPVIAGYTADQAEVAAQTVTPDSQNINKTVYYTADTQEATINFYDETDHKLLDNQTIHLTGKTGEKVDRTQADQTLADLVKQGYVLDKENTAKAFPADAVYDNNDQTPQEFTIYLKHGTTHTDATSSKADQKTVSETIHYVYKDGVNANKPVADDANTTVTFKRGYTTDKVTGKIVSYDPWTVDGKQADSKTFDAVKSPVIAGYTADQAEVAAQTVTPDSQNINKTVYYTADTQEAAINFYDETGHKLLDNQTIHLTGKTGEKVDRTQADQTLAELEKQGYVLDENNTKLGFPSNAAYDDDDVKPQEFTIYLKHGMTHTDATDKNAEQKIVTETIHYVYENNQTAKTDYTSAVDFKRGYTTDNVTHKIISYDPWMVSSKKFGFVKSPAIEGYTPNHSQIDEITVTPDSKDVVKTVVYVGNAQEAQAIFYDETTGKEISGTREIATGKTDETISFTKDPNEVVKELEKQGYVFDKDNAKNNVFVAGTAYDKNSEVHQYFKYYLKHGHATVTPDQDPQKGQKTVTQTIKYEYADGTATGLADNVQTLTFKRTGDKDLVTHEVTWPDWSTVAGQQTSVVTSPALKGYTADTNEIPAITYHAGDSDVTYVVKYNADVQHAVINYIDGESDEILHTDKVNGHSDEKINYSTADMIKQLEAKGYELFKDNFPAGEKFDNDDTNDQFYTVIFKHHRENVDPNHSSADGTKGTKTLTETVHYKYANGTKAAEDQTAQVTFTRNGVLDDVTGIVAWGKWNEASQSYKALTSPTIAGYAPSEAVVKRSSNSDAEQGPTLTVIYTADAQKVHVQYIDGETDQMLRQDDLDGYTDETIPYSTAEGIKKFEGDGYELFKDNFPAGEKFDNDDKNDQTYTVIFKHHRENVDPNHSSADGTKGTKTLTETVHYKYADGTKAAEDQTAQVTFTRNGVLDDVTGIVAWGKWNEASQSYKALTSPTIAGYTPSEAVVKRSSNSDAEQGPTLTVIYTADAQKVHVQYIDGETDQMLRQDDLDGYTDETIPYSTAEGIKKFEGDGYELFKDNFPAGEKFDNDDKNDQTYTVIFKHHRENVDPNHSSADGTKGTKTLTETVHYKYANGTKAAEDQTAQVTFTRNGVLDDVTGIVAWGKWNEASQSYKALTSPTIAGYAPSEAVVKRSSNSDAEQGPTLTVIYTADAQKVHVQYIDGETDQMLRQDDLDGYTDETIPYSTAEGIKKFEGDGYELFKDNFPAGEKFDNDDKNDQTYTVIFKHHRENVDPNHSSADGTKGTKTLTETVHYKYANGTKAAEDQTAQVTFTRNGVLDDVTGIVAWGKWNEASQSYKALTSPTIAGYAPSEAVVKRSSNSDAEQGPTLTVIYTADAQKVHVQYIDGETDQMLRQDDLDGYTDETIPYSTAEGIKKFEGDGYELFKDNFPAGEKFDNDDKNDQTYTVIFKHHRENVDPNHSSADGTKGTKTLTETVHYKYADGTKAAEDQTAQVTFTRNGVLDDVTGIVAWGKWNEASQSYKALTSPTIAGYTPSEAVVKRSSNSDAEQGPTLTVIYTADAQTAYVKYVDDTTGETLRQDDLHGYTDETIPYSTAEGIKKYEGDGYVLVSDGFKPGTKFGVGTPTYEVHFKHGMTHTDATDKNAEQKTVTETIHYVDENNQTVQPDSTTAVTFKRGYTTDNVTGKVVSYDPWTVDGNQADSKTFAAVPSPAVEGYTPNHQQINEFTVTPDSKDIVKTVVYVGDPQEAQAIFYDETTGKEISNTREIVNGKTDETIGFTKDPNEVVKELEKQGYVFDKDNANNNVFAAGTTYDKNSEVHQYFKYYFTHATTIVTPDNPKTPADVLPDNPGKNYPSGVAKDDLNKTVTRTINITTPDGKTQTITQKAEFTRSATVDEVTGEVTYGPWSKNVVLESVDVPNISGYVPSASVPEITVTPNDQDMTINITYKKLDSGKAADQGGNASNGGQATNGGSTTGQSAQNGQSGQTQNNAGAQQLPQTGNANNEKGALGLASAMFAAGLGLGFGSKKKCHED